MLVVVDHNDTVTLFFSENNFINLSILLFFISYLRNILFDRANGKKEWRKK